MIQRFDCDGNPIAGTVLIDECGSCGMPLLPREFHPYAACVLFKDRHDGSMVWDQFHLIAKYVKVSQPEVKPA